MKARARKKKQKPAKKKVARKPAKKSKYDDKHYVYRPLSEAELTRSLETDLQDAWRKLRSFAHSLGEQRIYTSEKAIMFSRRICYLFVRPKKSYLEVVFFLPEIVEHPFIKRGNRVSKTKAANSFRLIHADQVEEPLTKWIQEAYAFVGV